MKNLRNIFILFVLSLAFYSCTSEVTVTDPKNETLDQIDTKTGNEGNEGEERPGGQ